MFTVEQRDALRERVLRLAEDDERAVAGAAVGSLALGGGDRHSDLDLTFAIRDDVPIAAPSSRTRTSRRSSLVRSDERSPHPFACSSEGSEARLPHAETVAQRLAELH